MKSIYVVFLSGLLCAVLAGCGTTGTSQGASLGALMGALIDGEEGLVEGAILGGAVGAADDYAQSRQMSEARKRYETQMRMQIEKERLALEKSRVSADPATSPAPREKNRLVGSSWRIISVVADEPEETSYSSMVVTFSTNTRMTTLAVYPDGTSESFVDQYTVLDDILVVRAPDSVINAKFQITGGQMLLSAPGLRVVMEEIEENL